MKKFYLSIVCSFLCFVTAYASNTLTLQKLSIEQGTTEVVLPISLTNESSITGFQCDLYLPSGVTVATDEYGDYVIAVARTTTKRHTISTSLQADGALRILCTSMTNATFSGNSGTVLNVTLTVPESITAGTHSMGLKNIVLSDPDANRHTSPDMTATLVVEGTGTEESVNILSLQDLTFEQGTTEAVLPISLTNESSITGFQCDLYLPSGVTVATDEYGDYVIAVARTTAKRHTISTSLQADGALRILCTSMTNATFSGNSGTVLNVTLTVSGSMAAGTHSMGLKNIVLSDPDANRYISSDMTSSLIVTKIEKINITINQYGSATYCSKYALDFSAVSGLKAYAATGYNSGSGVVTLTRVMTTQPGTGLFLKGEPGTYEVPVIESSLDHTINMLVGTLAKTPLNKTSDDGQYRNFRYTTKTGVPTPMFYEIADGYTLSANKAYLQIPTAWLPAEAKSISLRFDEGEGTTDIEEEEIINQKSEITYDLLGRRVDNPTSGIYIIDGRKVVIK